MVKVSNQIEARINQINEAVEVLGVFADSGRVADFILGMREAQNIVISDAEKTNEVVFDGNTLTGIFVPEFVPKKKGWTEAQRKAQSKRIKRAWRKKREANR